MSPKTTPSAPTVRAQTLPLPAACFPAAWPSGAASFVSAPAAEAASIGEPASRGSPKPEFADVWPGMVGQPTRTPGRTGVRRCPIAGTVEMWMAPDHRNGVERRKADELEGVLAGP